MGGSVVVPAVSVGEEQHNAMAVSAQRHLAVLHLLLHSSLQCCCWVAQAQFLQCQVAPLSGSLCRASLWQERGWAAHGAPPQPPTCLQLQLHCPSPSPTTLTIISANSLFICHAGLHLACALQWYFCWLHLKWAELWCLSSPMPFPSAHHQPAWTLSLKPPFFWSSVSIDFLLQSILAGAL